MFKKSIIITILILILSGGILVYASFLDKEEPVKPIDNTLSNNISESDDNTNQEQKIPENNNSSKKNNNKILFSHMNGSSSIWIMNDDGSDLKQIASENIGNSNSAVLSSNKDKIAYVSLEEWEGVRPFVRTPKIFGIRIIDLITDKSTLIVSHDKDQAGIGHPKFSPGGNHLAYLIQENKKSTLYITNLSNLTTDKVIEFISIYEVSAGEIKICWSPDGKKIAYLHDNNIYITDLKGNTQKIISGGKPEKGGDLAGNEWDIFTIWNLSFSSDGKQIKYTKDSNRFIVDINGKNNKQLEQIDLEENENKYIHVSEFIPNANKALILESWPKGHDPYMQRLLLYDIDSKETKVIYEGNKYYYPKISPDGKFIAVSVDIFHNEDESGMYFMDLNGENLERISSVSHDEILEWK